MRAPTVSAVVPVFNGEAYVAQTLESILGQSLPPNEIVVVDDGSTDGTADALRPFRSDVRILSQRNGGHAAAMNRGVAEARGAFVARCDADDVWAPEKLERQVDALTAHPQVDVAFTGARNFGEYDNGFPAPWGEGVLESRLLTRSVFRQNTICAPSTVIRRALCDRLGPFAEDLRVAEDYDYWLRALRAGAVFYYDPRILVHCRRHDHNATNDLVRLFEATARVHELHSDVPSDRVLARVVLAHDHRTLGRLLVDASRDAAARRAFCASLRYRPSPYALVWALLLSLPTRHRTGAIRTALALKRATSRPSPSVLR